MEEEDEEEEVVEEEEEEVVEEEVEEEVKDGEQEGHAHCRLLGLQFPVTTEVNTFIYRFYFIQ